MSTVLHRICVIGAGTMGHGIAQVSAMYGFDVVLLDATRELAERGSEQLRQNLEEGVKRQKVTAAARDDALARITIGADPALAAQAGLVIEAVPEKLELKQQIYREVEPRLAPSAILATNTSSLSITDLQAPLRHPERFIGVHFFNPVHINRLVEVIYGAHTAQATTEAAVEFVRRIDKEPVVVKDSPGFATSRLGVLLGLEAMRMVEEGVASAEDIDRALELGYRHPMGPLKLTDLVGLDVRLDIARYLYAKLGAEHFRPPAILERMVAEGKLGKKSGQGFYTWS
ncbi:MAG: 3-hydroxyacyl-CoA dehydrogenase family protein [Longimicrobiales bacterium]